MSPEPYLPTHAGFNALSELGNVDWSILHHAYGLGAGDDVSVDVEQSLALLVDEPAVALDEGLYSNVCHQGTVYQASAYALPFIAAVAAGDIATTLRVQLATLIADIAVGGSHVALGGSYDGAYGDGVDVLIRKTMVRCDGYLVEIEQREPTLRSLVEAIRLVTSDPSEENREATLAIIDFEED